VNGGEVESDVQREEQETGSWLLLFEWTRTGWKELGTRSNPLLARRANPS